MDLNWFSGPRFLRFFGFSVSSGFRAERILPVLYVFGSYRYGSLGKHFFGMPVKIITFASLSRSLKTIYPAGSTNN